MTALVRHYRLGLRIWILTIVLFSVLGQITFNKVRDPRSLEQPLFHFSLPALKFISFSIGGKIQNLVYGALLAWLVACLWDQGVRPVKSSLGGAVLAFLLVSMLAFLFSPVRDLSWKNGIRDLLLQGAFFFLLVAVMRSPTHQKAVLIVLFLGVCLTAGGGIFLYWKGICFPQTRQRIWLSFLHPNSSGSILVLLIPLALAFFSGKVPGRVKLGVAVSIPLLLVAMLLTFSRTAWLSLLFAIGYLSLRWKGRVYLWGIIVVLGLLLVWGMNIGPQAYWKKRVKSLSTLKTDPNVKKRLIYYQAAGRMFIQRPLLGYGPGHRVFMEIYNNQFKKFETGEIPPGPHNLYLYLPASTGILGLTAFGWLLVSVFLSLRKGRREDGDWFRQSFSFGLTAGLIGFLIGSLADDPLLNLRVSFIFWILLGLVAVQPEASLAPGRLD